MKRRLIAAVLAVLAVLGIMLGAAGPASAGDGYWTPTRCGAEYPYKGMWFGEPSMGVWFRSVWGQFGVTGRFYAPHKALGAECGIGFPVSGVVRGDGGDVQFYIRAYSCDLSYIVAWDNGQVQAGTVAHVYC